MAIGDRKQYTANQAEARHPAGDCSPGVQGSYYVATGTETIIATGARTSVAGTGSVIFMDAVADNGLVFTFGLFIKCANDGTSPQVMIWPQTLKTSQTTPLALGSVLPAIPMPNTQTDGTVVGP